MSTSVDDVIDAPAEPPAPRSRRWWRWGLGIICLLVAAMWAYAFLWRSSSNIYTDVYVMTTPGWQDEAAKICDDANARRVALGDMTGGRIDNPTPAQMIERADVVDHATDIVAQMVADLEAIPVTGKDVQRMATFQQYYDIVLSDRREYAASLRAGDLVPYRESSVAGGPVSNVVTDFTGANGIPRCGPPGELSG